jgi:hypothetical protein
MLHSHVSNLSVAELMYNPHLTSFPTFERTGMVHGEGFLCSGRVSNPRVLSDREYTNLTANNNKIPSLANSGNKLIQQMKGGTVGGTISKEVRLVYHHYHDGRSSTGIRGCYVLIFFVGTPRLG